VRFSGSLEEWPEFCRRLLLDRRIERVFLFGDQKPIHRAATKVCKELGVDFWALEEGYLRPDWVTIEKGGVNGNSSLPRDPDFYRNATANLPEVGHAVPLGNTFYHHAWWAFWNSLAITFCFWRYPRYRSHRDVNLFRNGLRWLRGGLRKVWYRWKERDVTARLVGQHKGRYFLLPLQVYCDAQLQHSTYETMEDFIEEAATAFAKHAPADTLLVVKHHPHDRAYRDYTRYLRDLAARLGLGDRLVYVHDLHLPTLLKAARGVITMNSTVGTSALFHHTPTKVLGRAVYDIPGLTCQRPLADFLKDPGAVDTELLVAFTRWLREDNQINGSFYRRNPRLGTRCGLDVAAFAPVSPSVVQPAPRDGDTVEPAASVMDNAGR
jgi:capsule polysaccharide modification protein KpsS